MIIALWLLAAVGPSLDFKPGQLVLVGAGDISSCSNNDDEKTAVAVERILAKSENARAFTLGDNVYPNGTAAEFLRCYEPTWGRFKGRTLPVVGNHDWRTPNAAGFRGTFAGRFSQDGPLWYSVDVEGDGPSSSAGASGSAAAKVKWHVVVLDSDCDKVGCGKGSPQYKWLVDDLKKNAATTCTLAMFHHPRFSSGPHGDAGAMSELWGVLDDAGVDLVLAGHDHTYERFPALTKEGLVVKGKGIPSIVAGTGGSSHYPIVIAREHSTFRDTSNFGVLQLNLEEGGWVAGFLPIGGNPVDVHRGVCRPPTVPTTKTTPPLPTPPPPPATTPTTPQDSDQQPRVD